MPFGGLWVINFILCFSRCYLFNTEVEDDSDDVEDPARNELTVSSLNTTLESLGQSPIRRYKVNRSLKYPTEKYSNASKALETAFAAVLGEDCVMEEKKSQTGQYEADGEEIIRQLKEKFRICTKASDKTQVLSVLPKSLTVRKIQSKLN